MVEQASMQLKCYINAVGSSIQHDIACTLTSRDMDFKYTFFLISSYDAINFP